MRNTLKAARLAEKLTQKALAEKVGVSDRTIGALERVRIDGSVKLWDRLEAVLGVPQQTLRRVDETADGAGSVPWEG